MSEFTGSAESGRRPYKLRSNFPGDVSDAAAEALLLNNQILRPKNSTQLKVYLASPGLKSARVRTIGLL